MEYEGLSKEEIEDFDEENPLEKIIKAWAIIFEDINSEIQIAYPIYRSKEEAKIGAEKERIKHKKIVYKIKKVEIKILNSL